jgi:hypothetical protein
MPGTAKRQAAASSSDLSVLYTWILVKVVIDGEAAFLIEAEAFPISELATHNSGDGGVDLACHAP